MLIKVKAVPGAGEERIEKKSEDSFEVWVREKPVKGQANRAITRVLSEYFKKEVKLIKGGKSSSKIFEILE